MEEFIIRPAYHLTRNGHISVSTSYSHFRLMLLSDTAVLENKVFFFLISILHLNETSYNYNGFVCGFVSCAYTTADRT